MKNIIVAVLIFAVCCLVVPAIICCAVGPDDVETIINTPEYKAELARRLY